MAKHFKVLFTQAGPFPKDRIITEEEIAAEKCDLEHLLKVGAICPSDAPLDDAKQKVRSADNPRAAELNESLDQKRAAKKADKAELPAKGDPVKK
jgi:hypothetical protein